MSLQKTALLGACSVMLAMIGCDGPRAEVDGGRDAGMVSLMDAGEDAGTVTMDDAGTDSGMISTDDAGTDSGIVADSGPPDGGTDAGPPDAGCVPSTCGPTECGIGVRDDGCGTPLDCGLCGVGGGCADDTGCRAGFECITETESGWTDGYCSRECRVDADCTASSHCGFIDPFLRIGTCLDNCTTSADCRAEYTCRNDDEDAAGVTECAPSGIGIGAIGDRCAAHGDCGGADRGLCLIEENGWHEGYCSMTCSPLDPCPTGSHCSFLDSAGRGVCLLNCAADSACRADGYLCINGDDDTLPITECFPAATGTGLAGAACTGAWDCTGGELGVCFDEGDNFRGGYCTRGCASSADCGSGSHCSNFGTPTQPVNLCTPNCASDAGCRSDGYACWDGNGDGSTECWVAGTGTATVGAPCAGIWECAGRDRAICARRPQNDFADGYCLLDGCTPGGTGTASCPAGSHCSMFGTDPTGLCTDDCSASDTCRTVGYGCYDIGDTDTLTECWPAATGAGQPGEPCRWLADCAGGEFGGCILENDPDVVGDEFLGGYCVQDCAARACPAGSFCLSPPDLCIRECTSDSQCRVADGYSCQLADATRSACFPAP